jgi:hypothetical protein
LSFLNTIALKKLDLKRASFFLFLSMVVGCAHGKKVASQVGLTESLCVDGLVANIDKGNCSSVYMGGDFTSGPVRVRCTVSEEETLWTSSRFYIFANIGYESIDTTNLLPVCQDAAVTVFVEIPQ